MVHLRGAIILCAALSAAWSLPASAGWKLVSGNQVARVDSLSITPQSDWNQGGRPGEQGRVWTQDGVGLNAIEFFSAVPQGAPLYKERDKKNNPMPKFDSKLLLPELADFFERSFRAQNQVSDFTILESTPTDIGGRKGLAVRYRYTLPNDELTRLGEARMAVVEGKLYVTNFYAPQLHYFDAGLPEARAIMERTRF
ncbi:hypothetical protein [Sphingopyxis soli]|jgi:hypothetical protein|uniref:hypothetical protein n=1 Tax=Sphingopyxis soli TaxID=592051 RepID=UPI001BFE8A82|nr:hypothetical protein [Sphingopyxis soli]